MVSFTPGPWSSFVRVFKLNPLQMIQKGVIYENLYIYRILQKEPGGSGLSLMYAQSHLF